MRVVIAMLALLFCAMPANATDGWQGRPSVCANIVDQQRSERCHYWVERVRVPNTESRCCGEADAYIADDWRPDGEGGLWMTITADYPPAVVTLYDEDGNPQPGPPSTFQPHKGMEIHVPKDRIVTRVEDANQSPHSVLFMRTSDGWVYCAILGALI